MNDLILGGGQLDIIMINQLQRLVDNNPANRLTANDDSISSMPFPFNQFGVRGMTQTGIAERNLNQECGYPETAEISVFDYRDLYDREPIAARVVEGLPLESWKKLPSIFETDDSEANTPFEQAWDLVSRRLKGDSWYQDEEASPIWDHLIRADILSRIGRFGVILLGIADGKMLSEPLAGFEAGVGATTEQFFGSIGTDQQYQGIQFTPAFAPGQYAQDNMQVGMDQAQRGVGLPDQQGGSNGQARDFSGYGYDPNTDRSERNGVQQGGTQAATGFGDTNGSPSSPADAGTAPGFRPTDIQQQQSDQLYGQPVDRPGAQGAGAHALGGSQPDIYQDTAPLDEQGQYEGDPGYGEIPTPSGPGPAAPDQYDQLGLSPEQPTDELDPSQYGTGLEDPATLDPSLQDPEYAQPGDTTGGLEVPGGAQLPTEPDYGDSQSQEPTDQQPMGDEEQQGVTGEQDPGFDSSMYPDAEAQQAGEAAMAQPQLDPSSLVQLIYLRTYDETLVQIVQYEANRNSPRFGQPVMYRITLNDPRTQQSGIGLPLATLMVHWSRVVHISEKLLNSEVFGLPALQQVYNRVLDLNKLYGGSAEMYWRGAFPGMSLETHPQLGGDVAIDQRSVSKTMYNYFHSLKRYIATEGMTVKPLSPQFIDPSAIINTALTAICIIIGMPMRIFMGSERGELSSGQDDDTWNDRLMSRQSNYLTPKLIVPFVNRLIQAGVLPEPTGFSVKWPDLNESNPEQRAQLVTARTGAMQAYVSGGVDSLMAPQDWLTRELGYDEEEAATILQNAQQHMAEAQPQQQVDPVTGEPIPPVPGHQSPMPGEPGSDDYVEAMHTAAEQGASPAGGGPLQAPPGGEETSASAGDSEGEGAPLPMGDKKGKKKKPPTRNELTGNFDDTRDSYSLSDRLATIVDNYNQNPHDSAGRFTSGHRGSPGSPSSTSSRYHYTNRQTGLIKKGPKNEDGNRTYYVAGEGGEHILNPETGEHFQSLPEAQHFKKTYLRDRTLKAKGGTVTSEVSKQHIGKLADDLSRAAVNKITKGEKFLPEKGQRVEAVRHRLRDFAHHMLEATGEAVAAHGKELAVGAIGVLLTALAERYMRGTGDMASAAARRYGAGPFGKLFTKFAKSRHAYRHPPAGKVLSKAATKLYTNNPHMRPKDWKYKSTKWPTQNARRAGLELWLAGLLYPTNGIVTNASVDTFADWVNQLTANHIVKVGGKYRLLSHKGKNLGTFDSHEAAAKHEGEVEYFKHEG